MLYFKSYVISILFPFKWNDITILAELFIQSKLFLYDCSVYIHCIIHTFYMFGIPIEYINTLNT